MKSRMLGVAYAIFYLALVPLHEAQASFVPISSSLTINGWSNLDSTSANPGTRVSDEQSTTVDPLNVSYTRTLDNGVETLTETGVASATWSDPSSGSVVFDLNLSSVDLIDGVLWFGVGYGFSYSFTAATDGVFTFGGSLSSTAPSPGLRGGVIFQFSDLGGYLTSGQIDVSGPTSKFISQTLVAGQDYFLEFRPDMQVWCGLDPSCDLLNRNETMAADLGFDFQPVPIPPAVWLFGSGLMGLLTMARRKLH